MKKVIIIVYCILIIFLGYFIFINNKPKEEVKEEVNIITTSAEDIYEYKDDNPIKLSFYIGDFRYVEKEITLPWNYWHDLEVFGVLATQDKTIRYSWMQDAFPHYWNMYENHDKYKIGYNLSFEAEDGHHSYTIINPDDTYQAFKFIQLYVYDDVAPKKGAWYSHLTNDQVKSTTMMTSIKLFIAERYKEITSPLKLTVFSYDGEDDFDPNTHEYRGNSQTSILIYEK